MKKRKKKEQGTHSEQFTFWHHLDCEAEEFCIVLQKEAEQNTTSQETISQCQRKKCLDELNNRTLSFGGSHTSGNALENTSQHTHCHKSKNLTQTRVVE